MAIFTTMFPELCGKGEQVVGEVVEVQLQISAGLIDGSGGCGGEGGGCVADGEGSVVEDQSDITGERGSAAESELGGTVLRQ